MRKTTRLLATALLALLAVPGIVSSSAHADIVLMKDGRLIEGEVVKGDMESSAIIFRANVKGTWTTIALKSEEVDQLSIEHGDQSDEGNPATPSTPARSPGTPGASSSPSSPATSLPEDGLQQVRATGEGKTYPLAIEEACRDAVTQVTGALIIGETTVENGRLINDKIVAFSNGIVEEFEVIDKSKVGTGSDAWWKITIDAKVLVIKLIEELRVNNVTLKANVESEALSQLGEVVSREERDHTAAKTIKELMQYYPHCIWTVEPTGTLRTQDDRTSGGEFIVAHKVRFEITTAKWNRFANAFKRLLGEVALDRKTVRLNTPRLTLADRDPSNFSGFLGGNGAFYKKFLELEHPVEVRQKIDDLDNSLGRVSIDTSSKSLRQIKPYHIGALTNAKTANNDGTSPDFVIGFHDTIVVLDRKFREAKVYAVPSTVFDEINRRLDVIEIYPSMINADGDEVGRPLHTREDCRLICLDDEKWDRGKPDHWDNGKLHLSSRTIAGLRIDENSRQLVIVPFMMFGTSSWNLWTTDTVDIEYPFAMTEEDMTEENLSFQVEVVGTSTPSE